MTVEKRNDEIDLIDLSRKLGNVIKKFFSGIGKLIVLLFSFLIRQSVLIISLIIIALIIGFFQYKTTPTHYMSSFEAHSNALPSLEIISYINNIHEDFEENNYQQLETKLELDSTFLEKILDIQAYKVIDLNEDGVTDIIDYENEYPTSDTTVSRERFVVQVKTYVDNGIYDTLKDRIIAYVNKNEYIKENMAIRNQQRRELISKLDEEISYLDSLRKTEYFSKENKLETQKGQILIMNEKETQLYHQSILDLYRSQQNYEEELELRSEPITITQDLNSATVENDLSSYLKKYGFMGLLLGLFAGLIIENFKSIKTLVQSARNKQVHS
jgi:hypothetical protein